MNLTKNVKLFHLFKTVLAPAERSYVSLNLFSKYTLPISQIIYPIGQIFNTNTGGTTCKNASYKLAYIPICSKYPCEKYTPKYEVQKKSSISQLERLYPNLSFF